MPNLSKTTRDHDEIQRWAEERNATPSHVVGTGSGGDIGILRFDFPGYSGEGSLEPISWEQFFEKFDERNLVLLYQDETAGGAKSNFNKLISEETAEQAEEAKEERARGTGRHAHRATQGASGRAAAKGVASPAKKSSAQASGAVKRAAGSKTSGKKSAPAKKGAGAKKKAPAAKKKSVATKRGAASMARKSAPKKAASKKAAARKGGAKKTAARRR